MQSKEVVLTEEEEEIWKKRTQERLSHQDIQSMWASNQDSLTRSDGSTASYYELPEGARELQDLISFKDMNGQIAEIFRACYRYGEVDHSPKVRDIKKVIFYAKQELKRLEKYGRK